MKSYLFILILSLIAVSSCRDEYNDPNPPGGEVIDSIPPQIQVFNPIEDSTYLGIDTLPIYVEFSDDILLENLQFVMGVLNVGAPGMNITIQTDCTRYVLDTFYIVPAFDTLNMNAIVKARDYAGHTIDKNYNFNIIK